MGNFFSAGDGHPVWLDEFVTQLGVFSIDILDVASLLDARLVMFRKKNTWIKRMA